MERLTYRYKNSDCRDNDILFENENDINGAYNIFDFDKDVENEKEVLYRIAETLADYEDTGLTSKEITIMQKENAELKSKLERVLTVVSEFMMQSQDLNCVMCKNHMKNRPFILRVNEVYGCDGNCKVPNYTVDDVKKLILTNAELLKGDNNA